MAGPNITKPRTSVIPRPSTPLLFAMLCLSAGWGLLVALLWASVGHNLWMPPDGIGGTATLTVLRVVCFSVQIGGIGDSGFHSILATDSYSFNQLIANIIILTVICFSVCILYCVLCMSQISIIAPLFTQGLFTSCWESHFSQSPPALWIPSFRFMGTCQRWQEGQERRRVCPTDVWGNGS